MILAFCLDAQDDGSCMLGDETFRPKDHGGYYTWRFGSDGKPHPATCASCGRKTNPDFVNDRFRVKKRRQDITTTYDGYQLVSEKFKQGCLLRGYAGGEFVALPADPMYFWMRSDRVVPFDSNRRQTRFGKLCPTCGRHFNVTGAHPIFLAGVNSPLGDGFYRTDLEFGSGHEQHSLILVGPKTASELQDFGLRGLEFHPVMA